HRGLGRQHLRAVQLRLRPMLNLEPEHRDGAGEKQSEGQPTEHQAEPGVQPVHPLCEAFLHEHVPLERVSLAYGAGGDPGRTTAWPISSGVTMAMASHAFRIEAAAHTQMMAPVYTTSCTRPESIPASTGLEPNHSMATLAEAAPAQYVTA